MTLTIAVASDLHCHPTEHSRTASFLLSDGPRVPIKDHPVAALFQLIDKESLQCDIIALPGDFTDRANHQGFVVGMFNTREIGLKLRAQTVLASLGNHDVDSGHGFSSDHLYLGRRLFSDFPLSEKALSDSFYGPGFAIVQNDKWGCLIVNSVVHHRDEESAERGLLTPEQLEAIDAAIPCLDRAPLRLCLVHHHPIPHENMGLGTADLMEGGEALLEMLEKAGFDILIHGHKHHPRLRYSTGANPIPVFASGSLSAIIPDRLSRSVRNTFHLIKLQSSDDIVNHTHGTIQTWEWSTDAGWVPSSRKSAGFPHRVGFGFRGSETDLAEAMARALGNDKWLDWQTLVQRVPEIEYATASQLQRIETLLKPQNIVINPTTDEPTLVGKTSTVT